MTGWQTHRLTFFLLGGNFRKRNTTQRYWEIKQSPVSAHPKPGTVEWLWGGGAGLGPRATRKTRHLWPSQLVPRNQTHRNNYGTQEPTATADGVWSVIPSKMETTPGANSAVGCCPHLERRTQTDVQTLSRSRHALGSEEVHKRGFKHTWTRAYGYSSTCVKFKSR